MSVPKEFADLPFPEPETLLWSIEVGDSEDDPPVRCLFFLGEGIELKDNDDARVAASIEKASRYASAEIERLRELLGHCQALLARLGETQLEADRLYERVREALGER